MEVQVGSYLAGPLPLLLHGTGTQAELSAQLSSGVIPSGQFEYS